MPANPLSITVLNGKTYFVDERLVELRNVDNPHDVIRFDGHMHMGEYQYWTEQLQLIVGHRVVHAELLYDEGMDGMKPVLTFDDGQKLELLSDEEGNAPGRFAYIK